MWVSSHDRFFFLIWIWWQLTLLHEGFLCQICRFFFSHFNSVLLISSWLVVFISEEKGDWVDTFWVKFLGSVPVPYHKGNDVLCAAMHKVHFMLKLYFSFDIHIIHVIQIHNLNCWIIAILISICMTVTCEQIATNRRLQMHYSPPSMCVVEINMRGVKIIVQDDCRSSERVCY